MTNGLTTDGVLPLRLLRQGLSRPARTAVEYDRLFRRLQPVPPVFFSEPGSPPSLRDRATFDDREYACGLRRDRTVVKGRFQGGTVAYVFADELCDHAVIFRKPLPVLSDVQSAALDCVSRCGPLYKEQIAGETGLTRGAVTKAMTRLQEAFLVHADHGDAYDEQLWFDFSSEFPQAVFNRTPRRGLLARLALRFAENLVFSTPRMAADWSRLPLREIETAYGDLIERGSLSPVRLGSEDGWIPAADAGTLARTPGGPPPPGIFVMHKADYLVRAFQTELDRRFGGMEILRYLLIDGRFQGAVLGHWRIGPHDVEDIALTLPAPERERRREEILTAVGRFYSPPFSRILRYGGDPV